MTELMKILEDNAALSITISIVLFVASLLFVVYWLVQVPADYFVSEHSTNKSGPELLRSVLGFILVVMGVLMLVLPGQGVVTMVIGFLMIDTKWSKKYAEKILKKKNVKRTINNLRKKFRREEMQFKKEE